MNRSKRFRSISKLIFMALSIGWGSEAWTFKPRFSMPLSTLSASSFASGPKPLTPVTKPLVGSFSTG